MLSVGIGREGRGMKSPNRHHLLLPTTSFSLHCLTHRAVASKHIPWYYLQILAYLHSEPRRTSSREPDPHSLSSHSRFPNQLDTVSPQLPDLQTRFSSPETGIAKPHAVYYSLDARPENRRRRARGRKANSYA